MRLLSSLVAWAICAAIVIPLSPLDPSHDASAYAQAAGKGKGKGKGKKNRSVRRCMTFQQTLGTDEESIDMSLRSGCDFDVVCTLEWRVACTDDNKTEIRAEEKKSTTLQAADRWELNASAGVCESDWEIKDVRWNCLPVDESP